MNFERTQSANFEPGKQLTVSLDIIASYGPCSSGWRAILLGQNKREADSDLFPLTDCLNSNSVADVLWLLGKLDKPVFTEICREAAESIIKSVEHLGEGNFRRVTAAAYAAIAAIAAATAATATAAAAATATAAAATATAAAAAATAIATDDYAANTTDACYAIAADACQAAAVDACHAAAADARAAAAVDARAAAAAAAQKQYKKNREILLAIILSYEHN